MMFDPFEALCVCSFFGGMEFGYSSKEVMIEALKAEYVQKGVVLTTKRSVYNRVELKCDLGGESKVKETSNGDQKRKKGSMLIGCTFEIICGCKKGVWYV